MGESTSSTRRIKIGGEERELPGFMAFKAFHAMDVISEVQGAWHQVLEAGATFKRDYEREHYVEMTRTEARRELRPRPLFSEQPVTSRDGAQVLDAEGDPVLAPAPILREVDGEIVPVLGPDPLEHLSEEDWAGSNQVLRMSDSPKRNLQIAAMVPVGYQLASKQVRRLMALALTGNRQLEEWDEAGTDINHELDVAGKELLHQATPEEFVKLAVAVVNLCQEELADPFEELITAVGDLQRKRAAEEPSERPPAAGPMQIESDESPRSAADSAPPTDGSSERSSTEPVSAASSPSESG